MVGLVLSVEARAQEATSSVSAGNFGAAGQLVFSSGFSGEIGYTSGPRDYFLVDLQPAADYFLKDNFSLGGSILFRTEFQSGDNPLLVGLGVRAGYNIPLSGSVSVWPRLGLAVVHSNGEGILGGEDTYLEVSVDAPFLVHVAPHFFIGGGPELVTQLRDPTVASLGARAILGGHF
jgi:hypothetical protein